MTVEFVGMKGARHSARTVRSLEIGATFVGVIEGKRGLFLRISDGVVLLRRDNPSSSRARARSPGYHAWTYVGSDFEVTDYQERDLRIEELPAGTL